MHPAFQLPVPLVRSSGGPAPAPVDVRRPPAATLHNDFPPLTAAFSLLASMFAREAPAPSAPPAVAEPEDADGVQQRIASRTVRRPPLDDDGVRARLAARARARDRRRPKRVRARKSDPGLENASANPDPLVASDSELDGAVNPRRKRSQPFQFFVKQDLAQAAVRPVHTSRLPRADARRSQLFGRLPPERIVEFMAIARRRRRMVSEKEKQQLVTLMPYDLQRALFDELRAPGTATLSLSDSTLLVPEEDGELQQHDREQRAALKHSLFGLPIRLIGDAINTLTGRSDPNTSAAAYAAALARDTSVLVDSDEGNSAAVAYAAAAAIATSSATTDLNASERASLKAAIRAARKILTAEDAALFVDSMGVGPLVTSARILPGEDRAAALTALANIAIMLPKSRARMTQADGGSIVNTLKTIIDQSARFKVHQAVTGESVLWRTEALVSGTHLYGSLALGRGKIAREVRRKSALDSELVAGLQRLAGGLKTGQPEGAARAARRALGVFGINDWKPRMPGQRGLRILSIDGGGTRAIMAFEMLKQLKKATGCEIHELFDIIGGTSTGAIIAASIGIEHKTVEQVELLYRDMIGKIFTKHPVNGPKMLLTKAYYDTGVLESTLQRECGKGVFIDSLAEENMNKVFVVSSIMSRNPKELHLFRNYTYPLGNESRYDGTVEAQLWEGLRASSAAPTYFSEIRVNGELHADGAIVANNPTAVALHETKCMYPGVPIEILVSLGNGVSRAYDDNGSDKENEKKNMGWGDVVGSILASATSTEVVHHAIQDLFPADKYFRFNPTTDSTQIDETHPETLASFVREAREFIETNREDFDLVARTLRPKTPRSMWKRFRDALVEEIQELQSSAAEDDLYLPN